MKKMFVLIAAVAVIAAMLPSSAAAATIGGDQGWINVHCNVDGASVYFDGEYKEEGADYETCLPVRKGKDVEGISVRELTGGTCVSLIHKGPYDTLTESYKKLYAYINEKGYKTKLPSREVYLKGPGMIFKGNPKNYLTEIQIMIEK